MRIHGDNQSALKSTSEATCFQHSDPMSGTVTAPPPHYNTVGLNDVLWTVRYMRR